MNNPYLSEPDVTIAGNQTNQQQDYDTLLQDNLNILGPMVQSVYQANKHRPGYRKALKQVLKEIEQQY